MMPQMVVAHRFNRRTDGIPRDDFQNSRRKILAQARHVNRVVKHNAKRVKAASEKQYPDRVSPERSMWRKDPNCRDPNPVSEGKQNQPRNARGPQQLNRKRAHRDSMARKWQDEMYNARRSVYRYASR